MQTAVEIQAAEKTYPNGTRALLPVNLAVQRGEFVTLLGPSGCGKSTLLNMVAGLLAPSAGRISVWGESPNAQSQNRQRMSFVFQEATLMPWARVAANVRLPLDLHGIENTDADQRVRDALKLVGLENFGESYPRELSGGRVIDEIAITPSMPRDDAFRVSTEFAAYAKRLQDSLLRASTNVDEALA